MTAPLPPPPPPPPRSPQAGGFATTPEITRRSAFESFLWTLLGPVGAFGGAVIAYLLTAQAIELPADGTENWEGAWFFLTLPAGFVLGFIIALAIAWRAGRSTPRGVDRFTPAQLTFYGLAVPAAVASIVIWALIRAN